jgi:hypothetical protein
MARTLQGAAGLAVDRRMIAIDPRMIALAAIDRP